MIAADARRAAAWAAWQVALDASAAAYENIVHGDNSTVAAWLAAQEAADDAWVAWCNAREESREES